MRVCMRKVIRRKYLCTNTLALNELLNWKQFARFADFQVLGTKLNGHIAADVTFLLLSLGVGVAVRASCWHDPRRPLTHTHTHTHFQQFSGLHTCHCSSWSGYNLFRIFCCNRNWSSAASESMWVSEYVRAANADEITLSTIRANSSEI